MRNKRTFIVDSKRQVVDELLSGESGATTQTLLTLSVQS